VAFWLQPLFFGGATAAVGYLREALLLALWGRRLACCATYARRSASSCFASVRPPTQRTMATCAHARSGRLFEVDLGRSSDDEDTFSLWMGHARP